MGKTKNANEKKTMIPGEWLYLAKSGCTVRQIATAVEKDYEFEIWEDAAVLEIAMTSESSMDVEHVMIHPKDEVTRAFVQKEGCEEVFLITFEPEEYESAKLVMHRIIEECGGMFCGDTEDFTPILR